MVMVDGDISNVSSWGKASFEYKWNNCVNLRSGVCNNIPNDNAVEIQVHNIKNIKQELNCHGANKSYESGKQIRMTTQVVSDTKQNLIRITRSARSKRERSPVNKNVDIKKMWTIFDKEGVLKTCVRIAFPRSETH